MFSNLSILASIQRTINIFVTIHYLSVASRRMVQPLIKTNCSEHFMDIIFKKIATSFKTSFHFFRYLTFFSFACWNNKHILGLQSVGLNYNHTLCDVVQFISCQNRDDYGVNSWNIYINLCTKLNHGNKFYKWLFLPWPVSMQ